MRSLIASVAIAATIALTGAASAADLGGGETYQSYKDETPYVRPFSWTGFYAGVQLGYAWTDVDAITTGPAVVYGYDNDGFIGGGHVGYNWQSDSIVFGLEADVDYTDLSDSDPSATHFTDVNWMGSVRARVGLAMDRALLYVTGGWAFADVDVVGPTLAYGKTRNGWTLGGGVEYAFADNLTGRLEYRYSDFENDSFAIVGASDESDLTMHAIRAGLSFKF